MKTLEKSELVLKEIHRTVVQTVEIAKFWRKNLSIREWLALLLLVPFSIGYLGLLLKALFVISTSQELLQIAQDLLFPIPVITLLTLILSYYFKHPRKDDDHDDSSFT